MRSALVSTLVTTLLASPAAFSQVDAAAEIAALKAEITELLARVERLEQARSVPAADVPARAVTAEQAVVVARREVELSGDLRYRHESIDEAGTAERHRHRIRARFGAATNVTDDVRVELVLATGEDDPVSANQTLGGGFDRKGFGVDRAFFTWRATEALEIAGGKMPTPFFRPGGHHLIYDDDLNPEGLALRYTFGDWFVNYAGLMAEEREAADDSILLGGQIGLQRTLRSGASFTAGIGYYDYLETQGHTPFWDGAAAGNRLDASGHYLSDFNQAQLFGQVDFMIGARPLAVFADFVRNAAADGADTGFALGAQYGEVSRPGTWRIGWAYQDLEADAVIGTFTDSDFAGGGTDGKGHVLEWSYGLRDRLSLGVRYFLNERGAGAGNERNYNRLQADVSFEY